jgi:arsenate reductase (glutaredoxin)
MNITFYHNPRCHTSRTALALLRKKGVEPEVIEYLKTPFSAAELKHILKMLGMKPRDLLRKKEAKEAGLDKPALGDEAIIAGMVKHPIAIERPIAVKGGKAVLGRPAEKILDIL